MKEDGYSPIDRYRSGNQRCESERENEKGTRLYYTRNPPLADRQSPPSKEIRDFSSWDRVGRDILFCFSPISNGMRANLVVVVVIVVAVIAASKTSRTPPLSGVYHRLLAYDECYFNYQLITRHG